MTRSDQEGSLEAEIPEHAQAEADCAEMTDLTDLDDRAEEAELESILALTDEELEAFVESAANSRLERFLRPGGSWGGSEVPVRRAVIIARRNRLTVTSLKRWSGNSGSDHHRSQARAAAADLSNGSRPTSEMLRTARQIAAAMGMRFPSNGYIATPVTTKGYRAQLIYNSPSVPNHHNHVHFGVRRVR